MQLLESAGSLRNVAACSTLWISVALGCHSAEPTNNERSLSEWLDAYSSAKAKSNDVQEAKSALRSIGTNAIPYLLDWGESQEWTPRMRSFTGFEVLGASAVKAIPTLARRLTSTNELAAQAAARSLNGIGQTALPALLNAITNRYHGVGTYALQFVELSPNARHIIPSLLRDLDDPNSYYRWRAADALGSLRLDPDRVVPKLSTLLQDKELAVVYSALIGLGRFRALAAPAIPAISNLLSSEDQMRRIYATNALREVNAAVLSLSNPFRP